jgi:hypothetical protein
VVVEGDLVWWGVAAQAGQVSVHEQAGVAEAELKVRELEEIVGVGPWAVCQVTPVGPDGDAMSDSALIFDEDTEAGVFGAADYEEGVRIRRSRERQGAREFIRAGAQSR